MRAQHRLWTRNLRMLAVLCLLVQGASSLELCHVRFKDFK
jgi:hypothetical protein